MRDWLVAVDDGLVQRLHSCTLCQRTPVSRWGICEAAALAVAYVLCPACATAAGVHAVERLLEQRYGGRS